MISPHKIILLIAVSATATAAEDHTEAEAQGNKSEALKLKLVAIASILTAGGLGASFPLLGRKLAALRPENDIFLMAKAFAGGVVLATGFVHILPDAFRSLTSPKFPFSGFIAMVAAIATLMVDTVATAFYGNAHSSKDEEAAGDADPASGPNGTTPSDILRQRIISQVLEVGMVVHSVVIGISLGAARSAATIKPLLIALCFHQFFEGMGLGGCISQARFKWLKTTVMTVFFSVTAPLGIGIGIGISTVGVTVEGVFESASAGILIYMALVDLLAADFMSTRMQNNVKLQLGAHTSLLLGAGSMSFLAIMVGWNNQPWSQFYSNISDLLMSAGILGAQDVYISHMSHMLDISDTQSLTTSKPPTTEPMPVLPTPKRKVESCSICGSTFQRIRLSEIPKRRKCLG